MSAHDHPQILSRPSVKVDIAWIQKQLDELWKMLYQELSEGEAVTRACMSNLIVFCDNQTQSQDVENAIPSIVQMHPARVILLVGEGGTEPSGIEAFISGCYRALASGWQVCAELIKVVASANTLRRLPSVTRAQLVGDLPTTLWWASTQPPPFAGKLFFKLADMSEQIIYDSIGWTHPSKGMQAMSRWVTAERNEYVIYNLAWRRLKPWRSLLRQVLDPAVHPGALENVSRIRIEHGPHALAIAMLLLGWLATQLGWKPTEGQVKTGKRTLLHFNNRGRPLRVTVTRLSEGEPDPHRLHWYWRDVMGEHDVELARLENDCLGIVEKNTGTSSRAVSVPCFERGELVAAQMAHRSRDKLFEQALATGKEIATVLGT